MAIRKKSLGTGDGSRSEESERSGHNADSNWLPDGWTVEFKTRKRGYTKGKRYKCYVDAQGHKCFSKQQVFDYISKIRCNEAPENSAFQTKRQRTTTAPSRNSDTPAKDSAQIPWPLFGLALTALRCRKRWEENKGDMRFKARMKEAERTLHFMTPSLKKEFDMRADWKYDPKTAGALLSRKDSQSEFESISTILEKEKNDAPKIKRKCCMRLKGDERLMAKLAELETLESTRERELFVGNLHSKMNELHLKQTFQSIGPVEAVELTNNLEREHSKRVGYIRFAKSEDAKAALSLNGELRIAGRIIKVSSFYEHFG